MTAPPDTQPSRPDPRSLVPSVTVLLEQPRIVDLIRHRSRRIVLDAIRAALAEVRSELAESGSAEAADIAAVVRRVVEALDEGERNRLRPVVNATGIVFHDDLGRAVLSPAALQALPGLGRCVNLQIDLETGQRRRRNSTTESLLCRLAGAEAAMVVSSRASAVLLILTALAEGREVVISRGQLAEIGGSFRLSDCIRQSGARMVEVGTTNKTHLRDYRAALNDDTAVVLRCSPTNYRIQGFVGSVSVDGLAALKQERDFVLVDNPGSGALVDLRKYGLPREPTVPDSISAGADLVCFSGDELIGGPQAGIIVGRSDLISHLRKHPLAWMLRVGKLTDVVLEQTLRLFLSPEQILGESPVYRMLCASMDDLRRQATSLAARIAAAAPGVRARAVEVDTAARGALAPATPAKSWAVTLEREGSPPDVLARGLRRNEPPVIPRVANEQVVLDLRTFMDGDADLVVEALERLDRTETHS